MRANWGGGGNLSGVFENLYDAWEARAEAAVARNKRRAEEEQAALDADTYDKWKNGLITDEQWLEYVETRVEETKGDPKLHQQWTETLREHQTAIVDAQTEAAYEAGEISVHATIGYYRDRLSRVEKNSPEYRELVGRYWQLVDTRDSDAIYADAEKIIDRIERGTGSYVDLLNYYKGKLKTTRKNSDLYRQIQREVDSIQDIVDGVTGRGGGGGGGGGRRRSGGGGAGGGGITSEEALAVNEALLLRARGGSVYDSSGENPIPSITDLATEDLDQYKDALMADLNRIDAIMEQEENNPAADWFTDPLTGERIPNRAEFLREIDNMYLRTEEMLFAINWSEGEWEDATNALEFRQKYITNHMQRHNSEFYKPAWDEQVRGAFAMVASAAAQADPNARVRIYNRAFQILEDHAERILSDVSAVDTKGATEDVDQIRQAKSAKAKSVTSRNIEEMAGLRMQEEIEFTRNLFSVFAEPDMELPERQAALEALFETRPDGYWLTGSELDAYINGSFDGDGPAVGVMETYAGREGLATIGPDGRSTYVLMDTGGIVRAVPREVLAGVQRDQQMAMVLERVGGQVQQVWRPVLPAAEGGSYDVWVDKDGKMLTGRQLQAYTISTLIADEAAGLITRRTIAEGWNTLTTGDGRVWYQDPQTRLWYADRAPVRVELDSTGAVVVDDNGNPKYEVLEWASESGVVAPFHGVSSKDAQKMVEQLVDIGDIDLADYYSRDESGHAVFQPPDIGGMYWDPSDGIVMGDDIDAGRAFARAERSSRLLGRKDKEMEQFKMRQEKRRKARAEAWVAENFDAEQQRMFRKANPETSLTDYALGQMGSPTFDPKIRFGNETPSAPAARPQMPAVKPNIGKAVAPDLAPPPPLPKARSGNTVAPVLPAPPRPNLPEYADTTPPPKLPASPPIKSSDTRRKNFREQ